MKPKIMFAVFSDGDNKLESIWETQRSAIHAVGNNTDDRKTKTIVPIFANIENASSMSKEEYAKYIVKG